MGAVARSSIRPGGLNRAAQRSPLSSGLLLTAILSVLALMAFGCSSTKKTTTTTTVPISPIPTAATPTITPTTSAQSATTAVPATGLSGTWSGQYSGAYQGTFTLTWQQSGTTLTGSIKLSSPAATVPITGNVQGNTIRFGAVGTVTYSGSVSGNTMSGTFQVPTGSGSGTWSATKSS
jgi:hypothetical protein